MSKSLVHVLDANSFIRSKREHYAFDFCPGYWDALIRMHQGGLLESIDHVERELTRGKNKDALAQWVESSAPSGFFVDTSAAPIVEAYREVVNAVQSHGQYKQGAKAAFLKGADPWLIAYARVYKRQVATYEIPQPTSKGVVKIPDVAAGFGVKCSPPYKLLRESGVRLVLV